MHDIDLMLNFLFCFQFQPKIRKKDSTVPSAGPRASVRVIEKLKKKLQEQVIAGIQV